MDGKKAFCESGPPDAQWSANMRAKPGLRSWHRTTSAAAFQAVSRKLCEEG
jgi:hypothetical protein